jgi:phosphoenolpyruvate phosphomutase
MPGLHKDRALRITTNGKGRPGGPDLREVLRNPSIARAAGAHDALSAVIAEQAGFDAIWASGFGISACKAVPDLSLLGMGEYLQAAREMAAACSLPVLADCDTGFGDLANVAYTVHSYQRAGIDGICIEDKVFPKSNSFAEGRQELLDPGLFAEKIACAKEAQRGEEFVVVARTEALVCGEDVAVALERAAKYAAAGADGIMVHSKSREATEITGFLHEWNRSVPLLITPTMYPQMTKEIAEQHGVSMVIYANQALRAAVEASKQVLSEILDSGSTSSVESKIASVRDVFALQCMDEWIELTAGATGGSSSREIDSPALTPPASSVEEPLDDEIVLYEKSTCRTSRTARKLLQESGVRWRRVDVTKEVLDESTLIRLGRKFAGPVSGLVRWRDFNGEIDRNDADAIVKALFENPRLLRYPIAETSTSVVVARPPIGLKRVLKAQFSGIVGARLSPSNIGRRDDEAER